MGSGTLTTLPAFPAEVDATTTQYNELVNALLGDLMMRSPSTGAVSDGAGNIGSATDGRPDYVHVKTGITVAGKSIDFSKLETDRLRIISGKAEDDGYPAFLEAGGGSNAYFKILGASTTLRLGFGAVSFDITSDLQSQTLGLAPAANNTCLVNGSPGTNRNVPTIGEWGGLITVDTAGSEINSLSDDVVPMMIDNGTDQEIMLCRVMGGTKIKPFKRGIGGTNRITYADNDTITLLKGHWIFYDVVTGDINTRDNPGYHAPPAVGSTTPSYGTNWSTNDRWYNTTTKRWYKYTGSVWQLTNEIHLGYAICDSSGCTHVEPADFDLNWDDHLEIETFFTETGDVFIRGAFSVSVAGERIDYNTIINKAGNDYTTEFKFDTNHLDDDTTITTYTLYYVYLDKFGKIWFSNKCPRARDFKKGLYHPKKYWRCIATAQSGSTSSLEDSKCLPRQGTYEKNVASSGTIIPGTSYSANTYYDIPPCAHTLELATRINNAAAARLYYAEQDDRNEYQEYVATDILVNRTSGASTQFIISKVDVANCNAKFRTDVAVTGVDQEIVRAYIDF